MTKRYEQFKRADGFQKIEFTLLEIDSSILAYLTDTIAPEVIIAGNSVKVPVIYGSPERWTSVKKDGYFRDNNGKIQKPIIMIHRTGFVKNEQLMTPNRHLNYIIEKKYSHHNQYDTFSVLNRNRKEEKIKEFYNIALPDHITLTYEVVIWTDTIEQNNLICEKINYASEDYWGDEKKMKYRVQSSDYNLSVDVPSEQERIVKTNFTLTVNSYLLPRRDEIGKDTIQKNYSFKKIVAIEKIESVPINDEENEHPRDSQFFYPYSQPPSKKLPK